MNGSIDDALPSSAASSSAAQVASLYSNTSHGNLPAATPLTIGSSGTVDLGAFNQTVLSLNGNSGSMLTNGGASLATLTVTPAASTTAVYAGVIQNGSVSGTVGLTVNGAGTQILSNANTYTGPTTVLGGNLRLTSTGSLASAVTVGGSGSSGTPSLSGTGNAAGTVLVNGPSPGVAGHLAPGLNTSGNGGAIGTLSTGALTLNAGSILDFDFGTGGSGGGANAGNSDLVAVNGALTFPAAGSVTINLADNAGANGLGSFGLGTYKLFTASSTPNFTSSSLVVGTSALTGRVYSFTSTGTEVDMTVNVLSWSATAATSAWGTASNWNGNAIPGALGTTNNLGAATFNTNSTTLLVAPDNTRNLQNIVFDSAAVGAYTIGTTGGFALNLTSGGGVQMTTSTVATTEIVNARRS